ncbi:MAG: sulfatase [Candidatus Nitrohelix vancouverensis]|uniref:Sulfatase n=1 Tax=Candidatus Nitrohelix vancouverensis TaxID=2705534 RepID=A0A7T0C253_9BACT|nr:MAG: sulfatase [Candidatus Nitrohelix vancouverensis]
MTITQHLSIKKRAFLIVFAFTLLGAASWQGIRLVQIFSGEASPTRANLIIVTLDTLRPDHLNAYGYSRDTSPVMQALANEGLLFENAFSIATNSAPSHASLLTGLYPFQHGLVDNGQALPDHAPILSDFLKGKGYETAAFVGYYALAEESGLNRGFDTFEYHKIESHDHDDKSLEKDIAVFTAFRNWLENWSNLTKEPSNEVSQRENFFVWLHVQNIHESYDPPPPYDSMYADIPPPQTLEGFDGLFNIRCSNDLATAWRQGLLPDEFKGPVQALYDGEIRLVDDQLGELIDLLKRKGLYDNTALLLVADHGELLFEYPEGGVFKKGPGHTARYYDPAIRIPLIIKPPKAKAMQPHRVKRMVSSIDVAPTALDLLGFPSVAGLAGHSLLNDTHTPYVFAQETPYETEYEMIRSKDWKLVRETDDFGDERRLLFDLRNAGIENEVSEQHPEKVSEYVALLDQWRRDHTSKPSVQDNKEISDAMRAALIAGGYLPKETP